MGAELKVSAYGLSTTGNSLNLDNMYVNGRFVNVGSDTQSTMNKVTHDEFQVYGVCDSEIGITDNREIGVETGVSVMTMLQNTQNALKDAGKIEKSIIWEGLVDANRFVKQRRVKLGLDTLGSSFAGLFLHGNRGLAVHLGDSRIYVIRGGRMLQITDDHLESSDMFRLGVLSQAQSEVHKKESNLTAYIGMDGIYDARDEAFSKYFIFYPDDTFVLCTDGVSDAIWNDEMERLLRLLKNAPVDQLASLLMKAASEKASDDMTLVVLHIDDAPGEAPRRGGAAIPRRESYESEEEGAAAEQRPQGAASAGLQGGPVRAAEEEDDYEDYEEEEDTGGGGVMGFLSGLRLPQIFKKSGGGAAGRPADRYPEDDGYEVEEEEGGSFFERLLADKRTLLLYAGIAVVGILLIVLIIVAIVRGGNKENSSSLPGSSSQTTSTTSIQNSSSLVIPTISSSNVSASNSSRAPESSSDSSSESRSDSSEQSSSQTSQITEEIEYTIEAGDTLGRIVQKLYGDQNFSVVEALARYNNMSINDVILVGDVLKCPPLSDLQ